MKVVRGIDHINLRVISLKDSLKFYKEYLSFEVLEQGERESNRWAIVGVPGVIALCLYEYIEPKIINHEQSGLGHLGFNVERFDEFYQFIKKSKIGVSHEMVHHKKSRSFYIEDPSGYEIEISENFAGGL